MSTTNSRKIPLNLKLLQKNQENSGEGSTNSQRNQQQGSLQDSNDDQNNQQQFSIDYEDDSPFTLKCKDNVDKNFSQPGQDFKKVGMSQSTFFSPPLTKSISSNTFQSPGNINNKQETKPQKQRFVRRHFQQNQATPTDTQQQGMQKNLTQIETNKEKMEYIQQLYKRQFSNQISASLINLKEKNPFSNNVIANVVENSTLSKNKFQKQMQVQKINPAFKLDEQFVQTMTQFKKDPFNNNQESLLFNTFRSQESLDGDVPVVYTAKHGHRNLRLVSKTTNDLDQPNSPHLNKQTSIQNKQTKTNEQISEIEQKNLIELYHQNVQSSMTECLPNYDDQVNSSAQSNESKNSSQLIKNFDTSQSPTKMSIFKLKSENDINFKTIGVSSSQENSQCNTPPLQKKQLNILNEYSDEKIKDVVKSAASVNYIQDLNQDQTNNTITLTKQSSQTFRQQAQKQNQVQFKDIKELKNSETEYANLFKSGSQIFASSHSLKEIDEKILNNKKTEGSNIRIRSFKTDKANNKNTPFGTTSKGKQTTASNGKDLFFCSYQNIEKINQNDEDEDDFELFNYLSCNVIPDDDPFSSNNLDTAMADINQKNFVMRKIKVQSNQQSQKKENNNNINQSNQSMLSSQTQRAQSSHNNRHLISNRYQIQIKEQTLFKEPVK